MISRAFKDIDFADKKVCIKGEPACISTMPATTLPSGVPNASEWKGSAGGSTAMDTTKNNVLVGLEAILKKYKNDNFEERNLTQIKNQLDDKIKENIGPLTEYIKNFGIVDGDLTLKTEHLRDSILKYKKLEISINLF